MKRIIALIITLVLTTGIAVMPAVSAAPDAEAGILALLSELNIMSGDPDGNLRLEDYVSRAEFTKVAVAASSYKNSVATNLAISPFPDVTYKHWAAPYVRVGVTNGIVSGYPDGTFKPEDTVLYEEAITMLLRVLGYTDADFGVSWPDGQIGLADNLDMTDNVECNAGELMNRRQVAQLVYNTLKTKSKNSLSNLISIFDASIYEDTTLIASSAEDSSIASDEIFTTSGTFKISGGFDSSQIGVEGDVIVKDSSKMIAFVPDSDARNAEEYIVSSVLGDKIMVYKNGSLTQLYIEGDTPVYKGKSQTTFSLFKAQLELGDKLIARPADNGDVDYITYAKGNVDGPVTAFAGSWKNTWGVGDNVTVTRNGAAVTAADIQNYDVLYYLRDLNTVLAYANKVTGIYEKASPNRDIPTSVTISGKEYEIEGSAAFNKLYSGGEFEYGDTITVLLGRDNKIADVISPASSTEEVVGYLTSTGTKNYSSGDIDTFTNYYIKVVHVDGSEYEYITDKDYSERVNSVVELSFTDDGYARITSVKGGNVTGTVDWDSKRIGSSKLSPLAEILDVGTTNILDRACYAKIYGQRIDGVTLSDSSVLYSETNSSGEITKLILNNVTNDAFSYGVVTDAEYSGGIGTSAGNGRYSYISGGSRYSVGVSGKYSVTRNSVIKISGNVSAPSSLSIINSVPGTITSISSDKLIAGNKTYKISDKVQVYKRESLYEYEYSMLTLEEVIKNKDKYNITAHYDKSTESGGRIRVILVTEK